MYTRARSRSRRARHPARGRTARTPGMRLLPVVVSVASSVLMPPLLHGSEAALAPAATVWRGTVTIAPYCTMTPLNITVEGDAATAEWTWETDGSGNHCVPVREAALKVVPSTGGAMFFQAEGNDSYYTFGPANLSAGSHKLSGIVKNKPGETVGSFSVTKGAQPVHKVCNEPPLPPPTAGVHLTMTGDPTEMAVSWVVEGNLSGSVAQVVWTTADSAAHTTTNSSTIMVTDTEDMSTYSYCGGGLVAHTLFMVLLRELPVGSIISYNASILPKGVGSSPQPVGSAAFRTPPVEPMSTLRFLATADVGDPVSHSWTALPQMARQCSEEPVELGLHIGDIAYNLDITPRGDDYLKGVAPMASTFPWMMGPGNHEADCNYTYANYIGRFAAQNLTRSLRGPASGSSRWYSFELGPVHFTMFDTDAYGFDEVAYVLEGQYKWLQADLAAVNRERTPWIVLMSHRPMYCSPSSSYSTAEGGGNVENSGSHGSHLGWPKQRDDGEPIGPKPAGYGEGFGALGLLPPIWNPAEEEETRASVEASSTTIPTCGIGDLVRNGMIHNDGSGKRSFGIEPLMEQHSVDLYLCGHEHNYERLWPVLNGSFAPNASYIKPGKPVHIVTGAGGAYSKDPFTAPEGVWDAFRSEEWSYSDFLANRTHMWLRQRLATNGSIIDEMVLER